MPQTPSTRWCGWCPTPEQLMILEEMYQSGVRTPNAAEIQQITAHLAYYGRIEGKNVFYWFQNHKARERQHLRCRVCARHQQQYAQQQAPSPAAALTSAPPNAANNYAATGGSSTWSGGGAAAGGMHPAVMQLHHHHSCATSFMPQGGYFQQDAAAALPLVSAGMEFAACKTGDPNGGIGGGSYCGGGYNQQQDWTAQMMDSSAGGSSDMIPPCCRPHKTLDLFPTKRTGLKDEGSSSKSSSCSTSTNRNTPIGMNDSLVHARLCREALITSS